MNPSTECKVRNQSSLVDYSDFFATEALTLFDSICNSRWFVKTSIILFLNKIDLFQEKLVHSPLSDYFPDFTGGDNYDAACDYLLHRFVSLNQSAASKQIYAHYTCATDTQQIKCTFCPSTNSNIWLTFASSRLERYSRHLAPAPLARVRIALDLAWICYYDSTWIDNYVLERNLLSLAPLVCGLAILHS